MEGSNHVKFFLPIKVLDPSCLQMKLSSPCTYRLLGKEEGERREGSLGLRQYNHFPAGVVLPKSLMKSCFLLQKRVVKVTIKQLEENGEKN